MFKIPPITQAKGHYLDSWNEMIWEGWEYFISIIIEISIGIVKISAQGDQLMVHLIKISTRLTIPW